MHRLNLDIAFTEPCIGKSSANFIDEPVGSMSSSPLAGPTGYVPEDLALFPHELLQSFDHLRWLGHDFPR
jgi:hypothetical protein